MIALVFMSPIKLLNKKLSCQYCLSLLSFLHKRDKDKVLNFNSIHKAIIWAKKYHATQFRKSGEPFYSHPLKVAEMVSNYLLKTNVIVASILHDIVEDTEVTLGMIVDGFNWEVAHMVRLLTKYDNERKKSIADTLDEIYNSDEPDVLLIKAIDRLHNLQTLKAMSKDQQSRKLAESIQEFLLICAFIEKTDMEWTVKEICNELLDKEQQAQIQDKQYKALKHRENLYEELIQENLKNFSKKNNENILSED